MGKYKLTNLEKGLKKITEFKGYKQAERFDMQFNALLARVDITPENAKEWLNFVRTIQSTLDIITKRAKEVLGVESK